MSTGRDTRNELGDRLRGMADDLVDLVGAQLRLTRLELTSDVRNLGGRLLRLALFVPLLLVGHALLTFALVLSLADQLGMRGALLLVGGLHFVIGICGCTYAARSLRHVRVLDRSRDELERSLSTVGTAATGGPSEQPGP